MKWPSFPILFSLVFTASGWVFGQSNTFYIRELRERYDLNPSLYILALDQDVAPASELNLPPWQDRFVPFSNYLDQFYPGRPESRPIKLDADKIYWARVTLVNELPENCRLDNWYLFSGKSNHTEVYMTDPDGRVLDTMYTGFMVPASKKDFAFGNQYEDRVSLSLPPEGTLRVLIKIKVENKRNPYLDVFLTKEDFYHDWKSVVQTQKSWFFIGFLITFLLVNLLLYVVARDRAFLFHSLFQTGVFIYLLEFFYILYDLPFLREHPMYIQAVIFFALCLMDLSYIQFLRIYLDLGAKYPRLDKVFRALLYVRAALMVGTMILYYTANNMPLADNITAVYTVLEYLGMVVLVGVVRESGVLRFFILGGTALLAVGIIPNALSVIAGVGIQFSYTMVGGFGEVILFTLGLGYRLRMLIQEERKALVLKETDEFKTRFFTNITHEFRTPLTVIQGFSDQLRNELSDPKHLNRLALIKQNGDQLVRLLNRILDLSKLQSGKMGLNLGQGDIVEFLRYLVFSFQAFAWGKGIHIVFLTDMEKFDMDFDGEKLQDAISNLISNAIKFTGEGGKITVLVKVQSSQLKIQIKDTGIGMSEEEMAHLFERFYRSGPIRKKGQGSGLGLSITRELVKLMGGSIEVNSKPGQGASFSIFLPVTMRAPRVALAGLTPIGIDLEGEPENQPFHPPKYEEEKPLALIVDDNYDVVLYLRQLLEKEFNVVVAYDGAEGIEKAISLIPDIVLSDVIMPEKDGLELCRTLKSDERTSHIPIILATAKASVEDRLSGLQRGADAYLTKPFNQEELFLYLRNFVLLRKKMQERYSNIQAGAMVSSEPAMKALFEMEDAFLAKLRGIVESHLEQEGFGASQLARESGMSRSQLHRKITALTGLPASNFINSIRIKTASDLLLQTTLTISEIAYQVGLEPNYFSRLFKEETGQTPGEFRGK